MRLTVPPSILLETCVAEAPPSREAMSNPLQYYPQANNVDEALVLMLTEAWMKQTQAVGECRKQLQSVQHWFTQHHTLGI